MNLEDRQKLFENPTKEYRGKPFWSWNGKLEEEELLRQIDIIKDMGFGGYFMHSRTGLETEYLGEEWFDLTNKCADYGQQENLESWLYDEDRWPSGSAGGMVTKEEKYRAMFMEMNLLTREEWASWQPEEQVIAVYALKWKAGFPEGTGIFSEKRILQAGDALSEGEQAVEFRTRYSVCTDNYNGYCYVNTMDKEAIEKYIELTHEKYKEKCGDKFGKEISGIFTDEPHRGGVFTSFAEGEVNAAPYTPGMFEEFEKRFGYSLKERLPELFLRTGEGELSKVSRDYFELCQELFLKRFAMPIQDWCRENKLIFTGHVLHEDSLTCQAVMQGSLMRFYEYMDYPGIDILSEGNRCYWVAKQISSVARQLEKEWVLSELYGCTGWQMDFEDYKNVGDWQALFGVNLRCPHLSWYTMKGESKRDYPASIFHQSYWYRDYHYVEDYFSRIHAAVHGGKPVCSLLVLNPIESIWARAYSGAFEWLAAADEEMKRLEEQYASVFHILAGNQIDFDYGEEDILARHGRVEGGVLYVGAAAYRKVLVAGMDTMRSSTLELLEAFAAQGGEIIFAGDVPGYVDVEPSGLPGELAKRCRRVAFSEQEMAEACRSGMEVRIAIPWQDIPGKTKEVCGQESCGDSFNGEFLEEKGNGQKIFEKAEETDRRNLFTQVFEVEGGRVVMLLNVNREQDYKNVTLNLGEGSCLEQWDARSGRVTELEYRIEAGNVLVTIDLERGGERLYMIPDEKRELPKAERLSKVECFTKAEWLPEIEGTSEAKGFSGTEWLSETEGLSKAEGFSETEAIVLPDTFSYRLTERNICVLDMVTVTDGQGKEIPHMEVLKADRALRDGLGIPYRGGEMLQPWYQVKYKGGNTKVLASVSLRYTVEIEKMPSAVRLVVESLDQIQEIKVNGKPISLVSCGKWIDICFDELEIPDGCLVSGENTIDIAMDYYGTSGIEAVYLLGAFGVAIREGRPVVTALPETLSIGDITAQGLPFYSGSVIYEMGRSQDRQGNKEEKADGVGLESKNVEIDKKSVRVKLGDFGGSLVKLLGDGGSEAIIAFPPYQADMKGLRGIEVVLTRRNTFGPLHQFPKESPSYGPGNFMTEGDAWSADYMLYPQGLLEKPEIRNI